MALGWCALKLRGKQDLWLILQEKCIGKKLSKLRETDELCFGSPERCNTVILLVTNMLKKKYT